jgi:hypothetical protein
MRERRLFADVNRTTASWQDDWTRAEGWRSPGEVFTTMPWMDAPLGYTLAEPVPELELQSTPSSRINRLFPNDDRHPNTGHAGRHPKTGFE